MISGGWITAPGACLRTCFPQPIFLSCSCRISALKPMDYHLDLGAKLNQLRKRGVMIVSSGNVVHNLHSIESNRPDTGADRAHRFDDVVAYQMTEAPADLLKAVEHPDYDLAVPTPDHFIPLLYTAGLAAESRTRGPWCAAMQWVRCP